MIPSPPICIRTKMTACPNFDQYVAVSLTTRPVTQTAEVEVKRASSIDAPMPDAVDTGRVSKKAPVRITAINPAIMIWKFF